MKLHKDAEAFEAFAQRVSAWRNIPVEAVKRDYLIVLLMKKLSDSKFAESCVFKGGTSISKCYPDTIDRFSEDIDLTFLDTDLSENRKDKAIKQIEKIMWSSVNFEKISGERSKISKSSWIWLNEIGEENKVKLEIGSSVRPEPFQKLALKSYYHEYFEDQGLTDLISEFSLESVIVNVLDITRTFLDKVLAVKRHAFNSDLQRKVRHIYDVVKLYDHQEVQSFLSDKKELKELLTLTKQTDQFYIGKRQKYNNKYEPNEAYDFDSWRHLFTLGDIQIAYENLHKELLYSNDPQNFDQAIKVFIKISNILKEIEDKS